METRSKRKRIGPLPGGDRRGTPGADAGCFSMRSVSGAELSRRAPINKDTTAEIIDDGSTLTDRTNTPVEPYSPSTASYVPSRSSSPSLPSSPILSSSSLPIATLSTGDRNPTLNVAREVSTFLPASTKAGKTRVRMKWSKEVNLFIMRTYLHITKLEPDMTTYRQLHQLFSHQYPDVIVSEQRIADQRRVIVRNKLLSQSEIDQLKEDVRTQLELENIESLNNHNIYTDNTAEEILQEQPNSLTHTTQSESNTQTLSVYQSHTHSQATHTSTQTENLTITIENDVEIQADIQQNVLTDTYTQQLNDKFKTALNLYSGMNPAARPKLPKLRYSPKLQQLVNLFNKNILTQYTTDDTKLTDVHTLIYCTALVISEELNYKITNYTGNTRTKTNNKPAWQIRLERDIDKLRADCSRLTQYINNNRSNRVIKRVEAIFRNQRYTTHTRHEADNRRPEEYLDTLKQKLALKSHRLKRYKKAQERKNHNSTFVMNEKIFYRNLRTKTQTTETPHDTNIELPTTEQLEAFWSGIWEDEVQHNETADWISDEAARWSSLEEMDFVEVTESDITNTTAKLHNWKCPGIDKIHNYWFKKLDCLHKILAKNITEIILGKQNIPEFIATGITYMLPKTQYTAQPSQYRPITCLPTIYKIITSTITTKINKHIEQHHIIAEEQKGCRRGHMGCKEQLVIDSVIHKHAAAKNKNLHCTYIDYKKAFDSIPHSWLLEILQIYKINPEIIKFLKNIMSQWKTTLQLNYRNNTITTRQITIKKGIYQGDSLSPMWFCLALNPLSHLLHRSQAGYCLTHTAEVTTISHLIYMDDIKLYSKSEKEMKTLIDITSKFSRDINMQFGLDKCKTIHIIRGKIKPGDYEINNIDVITAMEPEDFYKYLGYKQLKGLDHTAIKNTLKNEYKNRVSAVCKTQLSSKHLIKALNTYAIPILTYSFGVIKWSKTEICQLERTTRTTLTKHNNLHPKSAIERLTIKRQHGGRGLIDIHHLWQKQIAKLKLFFHTKSNTSNIHKAIVTHDTNYTPLNLHEPNLSYDINNDPQKQKLEDWKKKVLHGRHPHDLEQAHIDTIASNKWLKIGNLFPETEGFIIAIQDQIINTKNYRKFIIKDPTITNDKCRKCHTQPETIQHITGACTTLTQTDYTHRHNQLANIIHQNLAIKHKLIPDTNTPYYKYTPQNVLENTTHKLYYDRAILTDRTVHYNRPDITRATLSTWWGLRALIPSFTSTGVRSPTKRDTTQAKVAYAEGCVAKGVLSREYANSGDRGTSSFIYPCHSERRALLWSTFRSLATRGNHMITRSKLKKQSEATPQLDDESSQFSSSSSTSLFPSISSTSQSFCVSPTPSLSSTIQSVDVVQLANSVDEVVPTTRTVKTRRKWTTDMNEFILRNYLLLTNMETDKNAYLPSLHTKFLEKFPSMEVSRQRIGDQRRAIVQKKLLPQTTIDQIYEQDTNTNTDTITPTHSPNIDGNFLNDIHLEQFDTIHTNTEINQEIEDLFQQAHQYFADTDPTNRPYIPKQKTSRKFSATKLSESSGQVYGKTRCVITTQRLGYTSKSEHSPLHRHVAETDKNFTPLNLHNRDTQTNEIIVTDEDKIAVWSQKALHGRHRSFLSQPHVDKIKSNEWLKRGELFPETEGFMLAIQDQIIATRNYRKFIMRDPNQQNDLCRHCNLASETIQHITGAYIAIPNSHNIQSTISEKLSKYQDLAIEIKTQWRAQTVHIVPIVLSTTGIIPKSLTQSLNTLHMPTYTLHTLQKATILNTCRITRKFLTSSTLSSTYSI
ncbi:uncharacterized protein LOC118279092 [Spodoptera frugiperda]|uniref:Uncharacterized protein LOC118279092 n=1 Tax=Spodoptera frugiperda TaxID=7108 RepID=A0A9R0DNI6_SPOFR|nr:uncharacterized protein LOC118279092 [Spodoptera frugiperda]